MNNNGRTIVRINLRNTLPTALLVVSLGLTATGCKTGQDPYKSGCAKEAKALGTNSLKNGIQIKILHGCGAVWGEIHNAEGGDSVKLKINNKYWGENVPGGSHSTHTWMQDVDKGDKVEVCGTAGNARRNGIKPGMQICIQAQM